MSEEMHHKYSVENEYGDKININVASDVTIENVIHQVVYPMLMFLSYQKESIDDTIMDLSESLFPEETE